MKANTSNVRVVARIRPLAKYELENGSKEAVTALKEESNGVGHAPVASLVQIDAGVAKSKNATSAGGASELSSEKRWFEFDAVFDGASSQDDVYSGSGARDSIVNDLFKGFNTTILAYGQTGAGKTHTMSGSGGLIPHCCDDLFQTIETKCDDAVVEMSYLEIYNEEIRDLLTDQNVGNNAKSLRLRETMNGDVYAEGLVSRRVTSPDEIHAVLEEASAKRVVAATAMNATSSRSHAMAILRISGILSSINDAPECKFTSKLTLVDLAGSERIKKTGAAGDRRSEGININKSLLVLGQVVSALAEQSSTSRPQRPKRKPPYRDSKLTRLLQDSLGGNSKTIMIACVSPADYNLDESINTLRYATTARSIQNTATQNIVQSLSKEEVAKLQRENQLLKLHVEELQRTVRLLSETSPASSVVPDPALSPTSVVHPRDFDPLDNPTDKMVSSEDKTVDDLKARVQELELELDEYKSDFRKAAGDSILELPALKVEVEYLREDVKEMEKLESENEELRMTLNEVRADAHAAQLAASKMSSIMDKLQELKGDELDKKRMTYNHIKKEEAWVRFLLDMLVTRRDEMKNLEEDFGLVVRVVERFAAESTKPNEEPVESAPNPNFPQRSLSDNTGGRDDSSSRTGWFRKVSASGRQKKPQQGGHVFDADTPLEIRQLLLTQHVNFFLSKMGEITECINVEEESLCKIRNQLRHEREELEVEIGMDEFVKDSLSSDDEGLLQQLTTVLIGPVHRL
jgi:Kinesin motor domain